MKTSMGRKLFVLWLGLVVAALLSEIILQIAWRGSPDAMNPQFNYNYLDIYKKVFRKKTVGGKVVYESSRPRMEKQVFSETKRAQTKRIFIIGESTAQQFNIPVLKEELGRIFHGTSFEIVNCGMGAYDAYRTRLIGEEIVHYEPDLVIIIVGNNEFHTTRKVNRFRYQSVLAKSKLFSVLMDLLYPPVNIDNLKDANKYYEDNLRGLFGAMHKNNVPAVICTLPVNYQYYNHLGDGLVPLKALVFNLLYFHFGDDLLVEKMAQSLESQEGLGSFVDYLRGKLHEKKEQYDAAYGFYRSELNSTKFPFSCPPVRNDLIRQIVKQEKIVVADVEKRFVQFVSDGISGFNLFKDNSHVWPSGYRLYTREIINAIDQHNRTADDDILAPIVNWQIDNITPLNYSQLLKEIEQDKSGSEHELFKLVIFKGSLKN